MFIPQLYAIFCNLCVGRNITQIAALNFKSGQHGRPLRAIRRPYGRSAAPLRCRPGSCPEMPDLSLAHANRTSVAAPPIALRCDKGARCSAAHSIAVRQGRADGLRRTNPHCGARGAQAAFAGRIRIAVPGARGRLCRMNPHCGARGADGLRRTNPHCGARGARAAFAGRIRIAVQGARGRLCRMNPHCGARGARAAFRRQIRIAVLQSPPPVNG
ncbi:hypothetical protein IJ21_38510 [Paenibacillus sp. 32O-W]|nr:hypothetical protein IJ21_38510 [Paenibacillus sp. 32O-W]